MNPLSPKSSSENSEPIHKKDTQSSQLENKTDVVSKKTGKSQQASAHKEINAIPEAENSKVSNVAYQKILQKYQESPNEPEISEEGIDELFKALDKFTLPMNRDSAFYDTDLIIIEDSFSGTMPLNGIKKSDMEKLEELFKNICDGKEKIKIIPNDSEDSFKNDTENLIKKLLTRNIGRKLIQKVLENSVITKLDIMAGESNSLTTSMSTGHMKLFLTKVNDKIAYHPTGKLKSQPTPPYITLGHELVHASHLPNTVPGMLPTFSSKYDDLEEQWTITGLKRDIVFNENELADGTSWNDNDTIKKNLEESYDELNEWNITGAFTDSQNVYYPRYLHRSLPFTGDVKEDIRMLVENGILFDLENLDSQNIDIYKLFENETISLFKSAIRSGDLRLVRFLIDKGFDINYIDHGGRNALHILFFDRADLDPHQFFDTVKLLIDSGVSLYLSDNDEETPLHNLIRPYTVEALNTEKYRPLMKWILNQYLLVFDLSVLFDLVKKASWIPKVEIQFGEIIWDCSCDLLELRLTESHDESEQEALYKRFDEIITKLSEMGVSTPLKENFSLEKLLVTRRETAWAIKLLSDKNLIKDLASYRTTGGDNLLHILSRELKTEDDLFLFELLDLVMERHPELLDIKNDNDETPQQILSRF